MEKGLTGVINILETVKRGHQRPGQSGLGGRRRRLVSLRVVEVTAHEKVGALQVIPLGHDQLAGSPRSFTWGRDLLGRIGRVFDLELNDWGRVDRFAIYVVDTTNTSSGGRGERISMRDCMRVIRALAIHRGT